MDEILPTTSPPTQTFQHKNENDQSNASPKPARKRSHSVLHWMHKQIDHIKPHRKSSELKNDRSSPPRQRSATTTTHLPPPVSFHQIQPTVTMPEERRTRSSTTSSISSTNKKYVQKKIISDTDQAAQQSPSLFQFVFMR